MLKHCEKLPQIKFVSEKKTIKLIEGDYYGQKLLQMGRKKEM